MTVSGDLSTIDLADLLQNIQVHSRTGTLKLVSDDGNASVFFRDGNVALMTSDGRVSLAERLVATGMLAGMCPFDGQIDMMGDVTGPWSCPAFNCTGTWVAQVN